MNRRYHLKALGGQGDPLADRWAENHPELLSNVWATRQPNALQPGNLLVYYAAGAQKVFAIARITQDGATAPLDPLPGGEGRPYRLPVQVVLMIPTLALAPSLNDVGLPIGLVMKTDYAELTDAQYRDCWRALIRRTDPAELNGG
jgi:hypothetical protein